MEKFINDTIDSVLSQTFKDIELIIVNDASTDSSEEIILSRKPEIEAVLSAFKYIKQENTGVAGACQTGFKNATGKYLMLLDGDDCLLPSSVEKQKDFLEKNRYSAVNHPAYDRTTVLLYDGAFLDTLNTLNRNLSFIRMFDTKQNLHQSTLSSTVFT